MLRSLPFVAFLAAAALGGAAAFDLWPWSARTAPVVGHGDEIDASATPRRDVALEIEVAATPRDARSTTSDGTSEAATSRGATADIVVSRTRQSGHFRLADGTWAPCLNGVKSAPPMQWPQEIPFSPIVRKMSDPNGKEWYVHEDGSYSNTEMLFRTDLGTAEAVTNVANPRKVRAVESRGTAKKIGPRR